MSSGIILKVAAMFFIPFIAVLIPIIIGQRYGIYRKKKASELQESYVSVAVGTAFGLLAFMLAFTFQIAANRYDARKALLLEEVTNIRTAFLRAGLVPEPIRSETKKLLVEYVDIRLELAKNISRLEYTKSRSQEILNIFWSYTETLAEQDRSSEVYALYTTSINDLVDNFNQRITLAFEYRIPPFVVRILFLISFFCFLGLGYQFGISGKGSFGINMILAFIFSLVMFLILMLDHPELGISTVNQRPMMTLQQQIR